MIGTNEEYNGISQPSYESSRGQGDLTTACGSCRKKISEATFDMTAGFNLKTPTSTVFSSPDPRDRLNAERLNHNRLPEKKIEISKKISDCNGGCIDKQIKLSTVTPEYSTVPHSIGDYEPIYPIDQLYGFKLPVYEQKDAIGEWYGNTINTPKTIDKLNIQYGSTLPKNDSFLTIDEVHVKSLLAHYDNPNYNQISVDNIIKEVEKNNFLSYQRLPCGNNKNYFLYDNTFKKELFFGTQLTVDCKLTFFYLKYINHSDPILKPLIIDFNECCSTLFTAIYCHKIFIYDNLKLFAWKNKINIEYDKFLICIFNLFNESIISLNLKQDPDGGIKNYKLIYKQIHLLLQNLRNAKIRFLSRDDFISTYANFNNDHDVSCLCGGELPTYCCFPFDSQGNKRPECWCPDGTKKNLCKDCEEKEKDFYTVDFWLNSSLQSQREPDKNPWDCSRGDDFYNQYIYDYVGYEPIRGKVYTFFRVTDLDSGYIISEADSWVYVLGSPTVKPEDISPELLIKINKERAKQGKSPIDINAQRIVPIKLMKGKRQKVELWIYLPCGDCCWTKDQFGNDVPNDNQRMVIYRWMIFDGNDPKYLDEDQRIIFGITSFEHGLVQDSERSCQSLNCP